MIRVLHVYPQLNNAGTERVIMNWYNNINRNEIQFDFLVQKKGELDNEIIKKGGKIYYIPYTTKRKYKNQIEDFFRINKEYSIIHTHTSSYMGLVLKIAKKNKILNRIAHSHTARNDLNCIFKIYKIIKSRIIENNATDFFACSLDAAKWQFPLKFKQSKIIYNAVDLQKYNFSEKKRLNIRKELKLSDEDKVVINVGRISREKNHKFILQIAKQMIIVDKNIKFLLVGEGPLKNKIEEDIKKDSLENNIEVLGNKDNVNELLQAADIFIFPSLYEGLGISLVEAQVSGLRCICSEQIPLEADIGTELLTRVSLKCDSKIWSKILFDKLDIMENRFINSQKALKSDYDIKKISENITKIYKKMNLKKI